MNRNRWTFVALMLLVVTTVMTAESAEKTEVKFTAPQQAAVDKIQAQGGLVLRVASSTDTLDVLFNLSGKPGTDAILAEAKLLPKVIKLNLAGTDVTDKGLAEVAAMTDLVSLHLERTKITDAGLAQLKGLSKLEYLNLYGTEITDAGLAHLAGIKSLKKLYVWQSKVTDAGVENLKKANATLYVNNGWVAPKEPPKEVAAPAPATPAALTIKDIMTNALKGDDTPVKRAIAKKSNPEELKKIHEYFVALEKLKPKQGDEASWKAKTAALVAASDLLVKGDEKGIAALQAAANCKACHDVHKGK